MPSLFKLDYWKINRNCEDLKQWELTEIKKIVIEVRHSFTNRNEMKPNSLFNENSL